MEKDFSPEERLLRLIKRRRKSGFEDEEKVKSEKERGKGPESEKEKKLPAPEEEKQIPKTEKVLSKKERAERVSVKIAKGPAVSNRTTYLYIILGVISFSLFTYFIFSTISNKEAEELKYLQTLIASISKEAQKEPLEPEEGPPLKEELPEDTKRPEKVVPFKEYQKLFDEKDIFVSPSKGRTKTLVAAEVTLRDLVKDLRLVGIMPGDEPQAIIEDKKSGQTLFLKKGERIEHIEIIDILNGRIVLGYEEETITLSL